MRRILAPTPLFQPALAIPRAIVGLMIFHYGLEVFNLEMMKGNIAWLTDIKFPVPRFMAYLGKWAELIGGVCLALGLLVRPASFVLIIDFIVICFVMGNGRIFGDDQAPFLYLLFFVCFLFLGGGKWSLDYLISRKYAG